MFKIARLSTIRFINSNSPAPAEYIDWDANADLTKLPPSDLIGIHGFSLMNEGKLHSITFGVTIAVSEDPNLFRITDYVDHFYSLMLPEKLFPIYNPSGVEIAKAVFTSGSAIHPINRFESRVAQSIQASAEITLSQ